MIRSVSRGVSVMESLIRFGVSISQGLLARFDTLLHAKGYDNRSEAIRDLVRRYLVEHEWEHGEKETIGTLTILYNHHVRELSDRLDHLQHDHHDNVISTLHVHLDKDNCLEVLVLKGKADAIRALADQLIGVKGVKHGQLVMTSMGKELE